MFWKIASPASNTLKELAHALNISGTIATLLMNRGFTDPRKAQEFLQPRFDCLADPFLMRDLKEAVEIDATYAPAMALAAYCYGERRFQGWTKDIETETAEGLRLMSRALELGRYDPNVLWMSALATWQLGLDTKHAQELAYRSLEANPSSAIAMTIAGWIEAYSGNYAKGKELLVHAQRLSPRDPRAWFTAAGLDRKSGV